MAITTSASYRPAPVFTVRCPLRSLSPACSGAACGGKVHTREQVCRAHLRFHDLPAPRYPVAIAVVVDACADEETRGDSGEIVSAILDVALAVGLEEVAQSVGGYRGHAPFTIAQMVEAVERPSRADLGVPATSAALAYAHHHGFVTNADLVLAARVAVRYRRVMLARFEVTGAPPI